MAVPQKAMDTDISSVEIYNSTNNNAGIVVLNLIRPGSASYNRIGRKAYIKACRVWGNLFCELAPQATTGDLQSVSVRSAIVWDKQPSGVLPSFDAIFGHTDQAGTETSNYLDPLRFDNMERFELLAEWVEDMNPDDTPVGFGGTRDMQIRSKHFDKTIHFRKTTTFSGESSPCTIADISTGGLYFITRANINIDSKASASINNGFARIFYTD